MTRTYRMISESALEVFLASGDRTRERLLALVEHYAKINGEPPDQYTNQAIEAVKPWQWQ